MADLTGHTLGQYVLGGRIGKGGMSTVYRARQESMDREVAIKVMSTELVGNEEFVARFEREARVIARLQHPHILPVYDFGRRGDFIFLVMRLVEGSVLHKRLKQAPLSLEQINQLVQQIASALEYAHRRGIVHRDLKPNNVLLDELDNAYLTDFGIAKMLAGAASTENLTAAGRVMGTPAYMAPEQWRSEPVDARTDIYALGVILYEMLVGALPFQSETPFGMMYKHFDAMPPPPRRINPALPPGVEGVITRALAKRPDDRYPSALHLAEELTAALRLAPAADLSAPLPRATPDHIAQAATVSDSIPPRRTPAGNGPPTPPSAQLAPPVPTGRLPGSRGVYVWAGVGLLVAIAVVIGMALALSRGEDDPSPDLPPLVSMADMAATGTAASRADRDLAFPVGPTSTDTVTPAPPSLTPTSAAPDPPREDVARLSATPDDTATALMLARTADAIAAARLTEIAASWSPTPSLTATMPPSETPRPTATTTRQPTRTAAPTHTPAAQCDALPARLSANQGGRTTLYPDEMTSVRETPGFGTAVERRIPPGQMFWVEDGPRCVDDVWWWAILGVDERGTWQGWIGEGRDGIYWVEPFDTGPIECPGAPAPRLVPGEQGRVVPTPPLASRVRSSPDASSIANRIGDLQPGETFRVISGPVCDITNRWRWWYVAGRSVRGWAAEGPANEYYLEPWP